MVSYRELQNKAKKLGLKASGTRLALTARIRIAETAHNNTTPQKAVESSIDTAIAPRRAGSGPKSSNKRAVAEPVNKHGKTKAQVKKDNNDAAALCAAGRM